MYLLSMRQAADVDLSTLASRCQDLILRLQLCNRLGQAIEVLGQGLVVLLQLGQLVLRSRGAGHDALNLWWLSTV